MRSRITKLLIAIVFLFAGTSAGASQVRYSTYTNERFFYSIEYPSSELKLQPPSDNGDGRIFRSENGKVEMRVWGGFNALDHLLEEQMLRDIDQSSAKVTYRSVLKDGFVFSGLIGGDTVYYQKTLRRKSKGIEVFYTFTIKYPASEKAKFDAIVKRVSTSLKFDPNGDV